MRAAKVAACNSPEDCGSKGRAWHAPPEHGERRRKHPTAVSLLLKTTVAISNAENENVETATIARNAERKSVVARDTGPTLR